MIKEFARTHGLRCKTDVDDTTIIPGIDDSNIYEHDDEHLAVTYMDSIAVNNNEFRRKCEAAGMEIVQDGDIEFTATFDPKNEKQSKVAIMVSGVRYPGRRLKADAA